MIYTLTQMSKMTKSELIQLAEREAGDNIFVQALIEHMTNTENEAKENVTGVLDDVITQFPDEDFLSNSVDRLIDVSKGKMKKNEMIVEIKDIIEELQDIEQTQFHKTEFARSEYRKFKHDNN